jgi:superfamily I DNA/RNA helicase
LTTLIRQFLAIPEQVLHPLPLRGGDGADPASKGLEFRAVAVMACDDEVLPLQARVEVVTDQGDREEVYDAERHLLYVACTRARDHLLVTGVAPASEFLKDLAGC